MLRTQRSYSTKHFSIIVKSVEGKKLKGVYVTMINGPDSPPIVLSAAEAELRADPTANRLRILLRNGTVQVGDGVSVSFPNTISHDIPLTDASKKGGASGSPSECLLSQIPIEKKAQRELIEKMEQGLAAEAAYQLFTGDFAAMGEKRWQAKELQLEQARSRYFRLETEPCRRYANGFSCFFFVFLGAPLAIRLRNSDIWTSFAICFLPILLLYYPLLAYGVDRAKCGALPPYAVWLGNGILLILGAWQLRKVVRH
jgi:lipopolysaccharide export system permease protein